MNIVRAEDLPPAMHLALSYAPRSAAETILTLFTLDTRLANLVSAPGEPLPKQLKLAWWRDRFGEARENWPAGEPLLARLAAWAVDPAPLAELVDGWEELALAKDLEQPALEAFATGRAVSWHVAAAALGHPRVPGLNIAARHWALADLRDHLADPDDRDAVLRFAEPLGRHSLRWPRALRPVAILAALGRRALLKDRPLLDGMPAAALAMRVGIFGR